MKLDELLNRDGFQEASTVVGQARAKARKQASERLEEQLVNTCENVDSTINKHVVSLREIRAHEKVAKSILEKLAAAKAYFEQSGNPLPFYKASGQPAQANIFCHLIGVEVPDSDSDLWKVPADFKAE